VITEDQVAVLFAKANPVLSLDLLDPVEPVNLEHLEDRSERSRDMTELKTKGSGGEVRRWSQRPGLLVAAIAAAVLAIGIGVFMTSQGPQIAATPVDRATAFWVAMAAGDRETAIAQMATGATAVGRANTFGRAHTLQGQFDWYESVGFHWAIDECIETAEGEIECTVFGRNAWSDALGVEPVIGTFVMEVGEDGITEIAEKDESFTSQWLPLAFDVFAIWVWANHPADAAVMFTDGDVNPEILDLYEINTERFVEAHGG
jgi:hypothetical protein